MTGTSPLISGWCVLVVRGHSREPCYESFQGDSERPNVTEELKARTRAETLKAASAAHASTCSTRRPHCESEEQTPDGFCCALWRTTCSAHRCFPTQRCPRRDEASRVSEMRLRHDPPWNTTVVHSMSQQGHHLEVRFLYRDTFSSKSAGVSTLLDNQKLQAKHVTRRNLCRDEWER